MTFVATRHGIRRLRRLHCSLSVPEARSRRPAFPRRRRSRVGHQIRPRRGAQHRRARPRHPRHRLGPTPWRRSQDRDRMLHAPRATRTRSPRHHLRHRPTRRPSPDPAARPRPPAHEPRHRRQSRRQTEPSTVLVATSAYFSRTVLPYSVEIGSSRFDPSQVQYIEAKLFRLGFVGVEPARGIEVVFPAADGVVRAPTSFGPCR